MKKRTITVYIYLLAIFFLSNYKCYADTVWSSDAIFNQGQVAGQPCIPETHGPNCDAENDETTGCKFNGETVGTIKVRMGVPSSVTLECNTIDVASIVSFAHKWVTGDNGEDDYEGGLPYEAQMPELVFTPSTIDSVGVHEIQTTVYMPSCEAVDGSFFCYTINSATLSVNINVVGSATPVRNGSLNLDPPDDTSLYCKSYYKWNENEDDLWHKVGSTGDAFSGYYNVKYKHASSDLCTDSYYISLIHKYGYNVSLSLSKKTSGTVYQNEAAAGAVVKDCVSPGLKFGLSSDGSYGVNQLYVAGLPIESSDFESGQTSSSGKSFTHTNSLSFAMPTTPLISKPPREDTINAFSVPGEIGVNVTSSDVSMSNQNWEWVPTAEASLGLNDPDVTYRWTQAGVIE